MDLESIQIKFIIFFTNMPVKKNGNGTPPAAAPKKPAPSLLNSLALRKIFLTLAGILLVYIIVFVATLIRNNIKAYDSIGEADKPERTILIEGQGKITAKPDIATTRMGVISEGPTVVEAQTKNTAAMNKLNTRLGELGIAKEDIQTTQYNIYPLYKYTEAGGSEVTGYQVSQDVEIKIRDLQKAQSVLALAGEVGANNVSGLQFTIDDKEVYIDAAREKALEKIAKKARAISQSLGVSMVGIASYNEYEAGGGPQPMMMSASKEVGMGGGAAPTIEPGSTDVIMNVSVVFEIR